MFILVISVFFILYLYYVIKCLEWPTIKYFLPFWKKWSNKNSIESLIFYSNSLRVTIYSLLWIRFTMSWVVITKSGLCFMCFSKRQNNPVTYMTILLFFSNIFSFISLNLSFFCILSLLSNCKISYQNFPFYFYI